MSSEAMTEESMKDLGIFEGDDVPELEDEVLATDYLDEEILSVQSSKSVNSSKIKSSQLPIQESGKLCFCASTWHTCRTCGVKCCVPCSLGEDDEIICSRS